MRAMAAETTSSAGRSAPSAVDKRNLRPAVPACIGLRVEAAVRRIVVFRLACGAHGKARHGGLRPVVGNAARDGEARAAVGAIEKRIAIAAVRRIKQFAQTIKQVAASAGIPVETRPSTSLETMRNPESPMGARSRTAMESIRASGGGSKRRRERNDSTAAGAPSISMVTPSVSFEITPARCSSSASRYTNGRKPTPCTTPRTTTPHRSILLNFLAHNFASRSSIRAGVQHSAWPTVSTEAFTEDGCQPRLNCNLEQPIHGSAAQITSGKVRQDRSPALACMEKITCHNVDFSLVNSYCDCLVFEHSGAKEIEMKKTLMIAVLMSLATFSRAQILPWTQPATASRRPVR